MKSGTIFAQEGSPWNGIKTRLLTHSEDQIATQQGTFQKAGGAWEHMGFPGVYLLPDEAK